MNKYNKEYILKFENHIISFLRKDDKFKNIKDENLLLIEFNKIVIDKFYKVKNIQDFSQLLSYTNNVIYEKSKYIPIKILTYHAFFNKNKYTSFEISKKSGGTRTINTPIKSLKNIQTTIAFILSCIYKSPMVVHGFTANKSVVTNAKHHVNKNYVYNIDLEDFFGSIHKARIEKLLQVAPYNLNNEVAILVSRLITNKIENKEFAVLPQGAPTSPIVSNMICERLDRRLMGLAKRFNVKYTRYADDMTFSSMHNVYQKNSDFLIELNRIIDGQNFKINPKKTRLQKQGYRQEVTGLIVNEKVNVDRRYIKQLRAMLYSIEKFGIEKAEDTFKDYYAKNKAPSMANVLSGKLEYLKMVKGYNDSSYLKLKDRYDKLFASEDKKEKQKITENKTKKSTKIICKVHDPKKLVEILSIFTQNNNDLKYTTHSWDMGQLEERWKNFDDFIKSIRKEWKGIDEELKQVSNRLYFKIKSFLFTTKLGEKKDEYYNYAWGEYKIEFGWSSPELKEWSNKGNNPFNYLLEESNRRVINNIAIDRFSDVVSIFKNEIEIRSNKKQIKTIFRELKSLHLGNDFKLKLDKSLDSVEFYTDVQWFKKALERIFLIMKENTSYPNIRITAQKSIEQGYIDIYIIQVGSTTSKEPEEIIEKIEKGGGDMAVILDDLCSLCEWSIEYSQSNDEDTENFRIDLLDSNKNQIKYKTIDTKVEGFTHVLRFYK